MNRQFMKTIILIFAAMSALLTAAHAQIGWTLKQCRERIGPELHAADGDTHYFHIGPWGRGLGEQICISFDPDGTVGKIQWVKLDGEAFSEAEIQQRLREASHVSWQRGRDHDTGELSWIGVQNGKVIFDANEADNGQGAYVLTISTRWIFLKASLSLGFDQIFKIVAEIKIRTWIVLDRIATAKKRRFWSSGISI
jgi:hypothetical protein